MIEFEEHTNCPSPAFEAPSTEAWLQLEAGRLMIARTKHWNILKEFHGGAWGIILCADGSVLAGPRDSMVWVYASPAHLLGQYDLTDNQGPEAVRALAKYVGWPME